MSADSDLGRPDLDPPGPAGGHTRAGGPRYHRQGTALARYGLVMRIFIALTIAAFVLAAPTAASAATTKVSVTATDFHFKLSKSSAPAGKVTFALVNKGKIGHDFEIAGKKTAVIGPGKSVTLTVSLKAGKYPYKCTVPGHSQLGMKGTFTVT